MYQLQANDWRAVNTMPKRMRSTQTRRPIKRARVSKATKALNLAKRVYRNTKPEVKHFDSERTSHTIIGSGTRWSLIGDNSTEFQTGQDIVQGTGDDHRVGDKIRMLSLYFKYQVYLPTGSAAQFASCRIIIVKSKLPNESSLSVSDGFVSSDMTSFPMIARRNVDKAGLYTVLYDRVHKFAKNQSNQIQHHKAYIRLRDEVVFNASSQKINKNAYFLLAYSDQAAPANAPIMHAFFRCAFTDV